MTAAISHTVDADLRAASMMMETEAEAPTSMFCMYCRWIGETLRRALSLMSRGSPDQAGRSGAGR